MTQLHTYPVPASIFPLLLWYLLRSQSQRLTPTMYWQSPHHRLLCSGTFCVLIRSLLSAPAPCSPPPPLCLLQCGIFQVLQCWGSTWCWKEKWKGSRQRECCLRQKKRDWAIEGKDPSPHFSYVNGKIPDGQIDEKEVEFEIVFLHSGYLKNKIIK